MRFTGLKGANLRYAQIKDVQWGLEDGRLAAILPDGSKWTPEDDLARFTNLFHPEFEATLAKINAIRKEQGCELLSDAKQPIEA